MVFNCCWVIFGKAEKVIYDLKKSRVDEYIKESFMIKKLLKFLFLFPASLEDCYLRRLGHNNPEDTGKLI